MATVIFEFCDDSHLARLHPAKPVDVPGLTGAALLLAGEGLCPWENAVLGLPPLK